MDSKGKPVKSKAAKANVERKNSLIAFLEKSAAWAEVGQMHESDPPPKFAKGRRARAAKRKKKPAEKDASDDDSDDGASDVSDDGDDGDGVGDGEGDSNDDCDVCSKCGSGETREKDPWIGCSNCMSWYHVKCTRIPQRFARHLETSAQVSAAGDWICPECDR